MNYKDQLKELQNLFGKPYEYEALDKRKATEEKFRIWIKGEINRLQDEIAVIKNVALMSQMIPVWGDLDKFLTKLKNLFYTITETEYIGSTFFRSNKKVKEDFEKIIDCEYKIVELMKGVLSKTADFHDSVDSALLSESTRLINLISVDLDAMNSQWLFHKNVIMNFKYI